MASLYLWNNKNKVNSVVLLTSGVLTAWAKTLHGAQRQRILWEGEVWENSEYFAPSLSQCPAQFPFPRYFYNGI